MVAANPGMAFEVGEWVVHPQHGVGRVTKLETKQFGPATRLYYEVAVPKSTVWVPVDSAAGALRPLTAKRDLPRYGGLLKSKPKPVNKDHRQRRLELIDRLQPGTFQARCEVVRDLAALGWIKPLSEPDAALLRVTRDKLCQEWAMVQGVTLVEATQEVENLLREARQAHGESIRPAA